MILSYTLRKYLFFLLLPLLAGVAVLTTPIKSDLSAFIIAGDNDEEMLLASEMQSGALSRRYVLSIVTPSGEAITATGQIDRLISQLQAIEGVTDVWRAEQSRAAFKIIGNIYAQHGAHLYSRDPETDLRIILSSEALSQRAAALKNALLSPQASIIKPIALQDPLLLSLNGFRAIADQSGKNLQPHQGPFQNLQLETAASGLDVGMQSSIHSRIISTFNNWNARQENQFRLEMTGVPVFAIATQGMIEDDITKLGALSSLALVVVFLWLFRSWRALWIVSSLLIATTAVAVLITHAVFGYVHGMTLAIGSTLSGVCMDYAIHGLVHGQNAPRDKREAAIACIWPSMAMGAITTSVGYGVLGFSGYPGFKQIAVYSAAAILSALLLTRYVLPGLLMNLPEAAMAGRKGILEYWLVFCSRHRAKILPPVVLLIAAAAGNLPSLHWIQDLQELTPEMDYLKATDKAIRERMISIEPGRFILISAKDAESALQKAEQVYPLLERLKTGHKLQDYFGLYPWILSAQQQQHNAALLRERLDSRVIKTWQQALTAQGLSTNKLGHPDYPETAPLTAQQLLASPLKHMVEHQLVINPERVLITIWLADHDPEAVQTALSKLDNVHYFSQRDLLNNLTTQYTERASILAATGMAIIFALLWLGYRRPWPALQTLLPSLSAAIIVAGGLSLTGQPLSFLHLTGFLLAISICDDFGIFFLENRGGEITLTYRAMAASMLTSTVAFGCLAIAETSVLKTLAAVVGLSVVIGFLLCPVMIKPRFSAEEPVR
ncbi:MAG: MMPL family transporter [Methylococcales bacterium]|nr:MMPL family transporter [Methylococcales bacterium]